MAQSDTINRRFVLAERPKGEPNDDTLRLEEVAVPTPSDGEMLLRTEYLSLDPYMRGRMSDAPSYAAPVEIGGVMEAGTVARVVVSKRDGFAEGDLVLSRNGWQDYAVSNGEGVRKLDPSLKHPSWALGILGMPGFTAWAGLTQIGRPQVGETLVVAAATGPVGATVGQIGTRMGCRVVGIAGGPEKCAHLTGRLGFDAGVDHKADGFAAALKAAVPDGIDVYFENVGGKVLEAVAPLLNVEARVPVCGLVSQYNATGLPGGPDRMNWLMGHILRKQLTVRGFIIFNSFGDLYPEFARQMGDWVEAGEIVYREAMFEGLEAAPDAFRRMLKGENFGKTVVKVA